MTIGYKKNFTFLVSLIIFLKLTIGCSPGEIIQEEKTEAKNEEYIFDEVPDQNVLTFETPEESATHRYTIQIGAFSTETRAKAFAEKTKNFFNMEFAVSFNSNVKLFVVRTNDVFKSRTIAEQIRNEFWKYDEYDDAWIVTIESLKQE